MMPGERAAAVLSSPRRRLGQVWYGLRSRPVRAGAVRTLTEAVHQMPARPGLPPPAQWSAQRVLSTETDVTVAIFGTPEVGALAIGRIADAGARDPGLIRNSDNLDQLHADPRLRAIHPLLPTPLASGNHRGRAYAVEGALSGTSGQAQFGRADAAHRILEQGVTAIAPLYEASAESTVIDEELVERWIGPQLQILRSAGGLLGDDRAGASIRRLETDLRASLHARPCCLTWTHGDFWAGNLLLDEQGGRVVGIVDWDAAAPRSLPVVDVEHLLLTTCVTVEGVDLGVLVAQFLDGRVWTPRERDVLRALDWALPPGSLDARTITLMAWLGHVTAVLAKRPAHASSRRWVAKNIDTVLTKI